jgi:hypothetical protein
MSTPPTPTPALSAAPLATLPLINNSLPSTYGSKTDDHLLEQYKLYVDSSQKLSDRRLSTNSYLFTINSSLLTLLGLLASLLADRKPLVMIPVAGCLLSLSWALLITSFKRLNAAKFDVIHALEEKLPARIFQEEWRLLDKGPRKPYTPMSDVERVIPWMFFVFYLILAAFIWRLPAAGADKGQMIQIQSPVQVQLSNTSGSCRQVPQASEQPPKQNNK